MMTSIENKMGKKACTAIELFFYIIFKQKKRDLVTILVVYSKK